MLKLVHTGDVHLGAQFKYLGPKAGLQREQIRNTFTKVVNYCIENKVNVVLIAGDLFDDPFPSELNINFAKDRLFELSDNNIISVILPGNHDYLETGSIWTRTEVFLNDPNILFFNNPLERQKVIKGLDLSVFANTTTQQKSTKSPLSDLKEAASKSESKYKVCMVHGGCKLFSKNDKYSVDLDELNQLNVHYVALGDWHSFLDVSTPLQKASYSGSPEMVDMDQKDAGSINLIEIEDTVKVQRVQVGQKRYEKLEIDISTCKDLKDFTDLITRGASTDLVREVIVKGSNPNIFFNIDELIEFLSKQFFYLKIQNRTYEKIAVSLEDYEKDTVIYSYMKIILEDLKKDPNNEVLKEALSYGVNLLNGKIEI